MDNLFSKLLLMVVFSLSSSIAIAGSNNGYTTAANVYSGSSSRGWYGGGVAHQLAEWKKEDEQAKAKKTEPSHEVSTISTETSSNAQ